MNWQPIETAPKDETLFLVLCTNDNGFSYAIMDRAEDDSWAVFHGEYWTCLSPIDINATHWMPLPEPPK